MLPQSRNTYDLLLSPLTMLDIDDHSPGGHFHKVRMSTLNFRILLAVGANTRSSTQRHAFHWRLWNNGIFLFHSTDAAFFKFSAASHHIHSIPRKIVIRLPQLEIRQEGIYGAIRMWSLKSSDRIRIMCAHCPAFSLHFPSDSLALMPYGVHGAILQNSLSNWSW